MAARHGRRSPRRATTRSFLTPGGSSLHLLPPAEKPVEAGVDEGALLVGQLTDEGGWISWADGGQTLAWGAGPVYSRSGLDNPLPVPPVATASATKDTKAEPSAPKLPKADSLEIDLEVPRGLVASRGARIVTPTM